MAPKLLHFINKLFRTTWKRQVEYGQTLSRRRRSNCVLKSVSSKSSFSVESNCSLTAHQAYSMESINFEFRTDSIDDLCCVRKCCEKCFCEEGEIIAETVRKKNLRKKRLESFKIFNEENNLKLKCENCVNQSEASSLRSLDSACDVTSTSSCEDLNCRYREGYAATTGGVEVAAFAHIHATACVNSDYETLTPQYENVPDFNTETLKIEEPPYDTVPARPPRSITEPPYENVLSVNCIDACVFRQISSLVDSTRSAAQMMESLQELHKNYSCVRRTSSADNEINYYFENYDEIENDLNLELERRLSD